MVSDSDRQPARRPLDALRDELNEFAAALDVQETGPLPPCPANPATAWGMWLVGAVRKANYGYVLTPAETVALPQARAYCDALRKQMDADWEG